MSALITISIKDNGNGKLVIGTDTCTLDMTKAEENVVKVLSHLINSVNKSLFNGKDMEVYQFNRENKP